MEIFTFYCGYFNIMKRLYKIFHLRYSVYEFDDFEIILLSTNLFCDKLLY